ncbi:MAG: hypothetical protein ACRDSJ_08225, partial [Rubrobacteraceae bacterium]
MSSLKRWVNLGSKLLSLWFVAAPLLAFQPASSPYQFVIRQGSSAVFHDRLQPDYHASNCVSGSPNWECPCTAGYFGAGDAAAPILRVVSRTPSSSNEIVTLDIEYLAFNAFCITPDANNINRPFATNYYVQLMQVNADGSESPLFQFDPY